MATSYVPLEGRFLSDAGLTVPTFTASQPPSFFASTSFIYSLAFTIILVTASFRYAYAGTLRMGASEEGIRKSKEEFKRVTYGLLGVLGLWLVLFTVNKDMLTGNVSLENLKTNPVKDIGNSSLVTTRTVDKTPFIPKDTDDPSSWDAIKNDAAVRSQLKNLSNGGVLVKKPVCDDPSKTSCTTVGGLPPETLSMLGQLRNTCTGAIEITGGTEKGHKSHGAGLTPVDLSVNSQGNLNTCIRGFAAGPTLSYCKATYKNFGYIFCDENGVAHWHVFKE